MRSMKNTEEVWSLVDAKERPFIQLSDQVWGTPELCYGEFRSCAEHTATLEQQGFRVTRDVAGIPTAVVGEAGDGGPVIAILGEYDALPGLSQEAGIAERRPLAGSGEGHACGHNLLGSASLLAATAVKDFLAAHGMVVPTVQARGATYAIGTPGHSWQLTAQGKTAAAHKGLVHVAKVMACTAVDVLQDDVLLARAKADHQARVGRTPYVCPLPDELDPPLKMSA
jgi:metal-dependent amidase/aminoacylase/carboxypeptidase family protein